jgi:hypothetical protein
MSAQHDADVASPVPAGQAPVAGVNPPQAREPGLDPQPGLDRRRIAAFAPATPRCWRSSAGTRTRPGGSGRRAATCWPATTAVSYRGSRGRDAALLTGAAGALAGPLTWLAPAVARLTSAMAGFLAAPGTNDTATAPRAPGSDRDSRALRIDVSPPLRWSMTVPGEPAAADRTAAGTH